MNAIDIVASAVGGEPPEEPAPGICCVTGVECETIDREHVIKPSFTNFDLLRAPESRRAGVAAYRALTLDAERKSSWWCDGERFVKLNRVDVRERVIGGVASTLPWAGYATTSYKKHGALRAPVNTGSAQRWLFELAIVDCTQRDTVAAMWQRLRAEQDGGIGRSLMEALDGPTAVLAKIGIDRWRRFAEWATPVSQSPLYRFLCYLLPSADELKAMRS